jgi:hypothetical protein
MLSGHISSIDTIEVNVKPFGLAFIIAGNPSAYSTYLGSAT